MKGAVLVCRFDQFCKSLEACTTYLQPAVPDTAMVNCPLDCFTDVKVAAVAIGLLGGAAIFGLIVVAALTDKSKRPLVEPDELETNTE